MPSEVPHSSEVSHSSEVFCKLEQRFCVLCCGKIFAKLLYYALLDSVECCHQQHYSPLSSTAFLEKSVSDGAVLLQLRLVEFRLKRAGISCVVFRGGMSMQAIGCGARIVERCFGSNFSMEKLPAQFGQKDSFAKESLHLKP